MDSLIEMESGGGILHQDLAWAVHVLEWAAAVIDLFAILLLLVGAIRFIVGVVRAELGAGENRIRRTNRQRIELGRYILAGLELFIVSDVIHTALSLAFSDLLFLLLLVIIRSITSYFLERELDQLKKELGE
ncbi:hypothetical protein OB2597_00175 [Pseudooceanicola batsensis HTCC2597]|uniref:DUF1622 domain-containing protein n=1 Tax=Pseudooceanicola batsensis (strain ATCC BAA-863 / DSM 15984 / KCTC 12145 / HTCC2597) TaxID=252305 RepID=A3U1K5_PSEBH|nr:DUF1622 domain-containing protein [Pseudooceanicola batsensis]EAQ01786.1 hypothetical protein OB2597_00175 [Pseudooceanicola batsensis HTCC2597]